MQWKIILIMCTYSISLDDDLVKQAEAVLGINEPFQSWLQRHVETWLSDQVNRKSQSGTHCGQQSGERLAKDYPSQEDNSSPNLAAEDFVIYLTSRGATHNATLTMNQLWSFIESLSLSQQDRDWLVSKLIEPSFRVDPFEISPSGDSFFADRRNVDAVMKDVEMAHRPGAKFKCLKNKADVMEMIDTL